ncbi:MAG: hypothetical protein ACRC6U_09295 [Fusobacteriaceae bacterium]
MNPLLDLKELIATEIEVVSSEISDFLLDVAWENITNYIGYDIMLQEREESLEGNGTNALYLNYRPIKSITETFVNKKLINNPSFSDRYLKLITKDGYSRYESPTLYQHNLKDEIEIKYMAGYDKVPNQIVMAATSLLSSLKSNLGDEGNLKSYKINTISYTFKEYSEKNQEFKDLLKPFICL